MSLDGSYDRDNVFARILRGELPCVKVYEDEEVLSFMDLFPQAPGHLLVVPKVPCRNLLDVPPERLSALVIRVQRLARAAREALSPDGISIVQYNGAAGGQSVFHLHFHVIPRVEGVAMKGHAHATRAEISELQGLAQRIAAALT